MDVGAWDRSCLQGLAQWEAGDAPFTTMAALAPPAPGPGSAAAGALASASLLAGGGFAADPAAAAVLAAIAGARRGLIVAASLSSPEDVVAAAQLSQLLGWPVAADVLSGLRAGVPAAAPAGAAPAATAGGGGAGPAVVHHFDQLLLLDRRHWPALRPDVVLQLGGHLTSKRLNQFLEWACLEGAHGGDAVEAAAAVAPLQWILAERSPKRHDQFHLLSHRLQAPLPLLAAAVAQQKAAAAAEAAAAGSAAAAAAAAEQARYRSLLLALDGEASAAVDAALAAMPELTEPAVARTLAQQLPPGEGLFVGNSMPIRDLDMYAAPAPATPVPAPARGPSPAPAATAAAAAAAVQGVVAQGLGAPVAANRGASGIDGVLSTGASGAGSGRGARSRLLAVGGLTFAVLGALPSRPARHPDPPPPDDLLPARATDCPPPPAPTQPPALLTGWGGAPRWWWATSPSFTTSTASTCCARVRCLCVCEGCAASSACAGDLRACSTAAGCPAIDTHPPTRPLQARRARR